MHLVYSRLVYVIVLFVYVVLDLSACVSVSERGTFTSATMLLALILPWTATLRMLLYLISCTRCGVQYVGETGQKLRNRINNHRQEVECCLAFQF